MLIQSLPNQEIKYSKHFRIFLTVVKFIWIMKKWIASSILAGIALVFSALSSGVIGGNSHKDECFDEKVRQISPTNQKLVNHFLKTNREINNKVKVYKDLKHLK